MKSETKGPLADGIELYLAHKRSLGKELAKVGNDTTFELPLGGAWSGPIGGTGRLIPLIIGRDGAREGQRVTNNNTRPADNWP